MVISTENLYDEVAALLAENREVSFRAIGNSMLPFIRGGVDVVHMVGPDKLKRGDVVLARTDDAQVVLHRVISIDGDTVALMGDGNLCRIEQWFGDSTHEGNRAQRTPHRLPKPMVAVQKPTVDGMPAIQAIPAFCHEASAYNIMSRL